MLKTGRELKTRAVVHLCCSVSRSRLEAQQKSAIPLVGSFISKGKGTGFFLLAQRTHNNNKHVYGILNVTFVKQLSLFLFGRTMRINVYLL